jgi:hypothetical protein
VLYGLSFGRAPKTMYKATAKEIFEFFKKLGLTLGDGEHRLKCKGPIRYEELNPTTSVTQQGSFSWSRSVK